MTKWNSNSRRLSIASWHTCECVWGFVVAGEEMVHTYMLKSSLECGERRTEHAK